MPRGGPLPGSQTGSQPHPLKPTHRTCCPLVRPRPGTGRYLRRPSRGKCSPPMPSSRTRSAKAAQRHPGCALTADELDPRGDIPSCLGEEGSWLSAGSAAATSCLPLLPLGAWVLTEGNE